MYLQVCDEPINSFPEEQYVCPPSGALFPQCQGGWEGKLRIKGLDTCNEAKQILRTTTLGQIDFLYYLNYYMLGFLMLDLSEGNLVSKFQR